MPPDQTTKIWVILARLNVAEKTDDMDVPAFRLHSLTGDRKDFWAVTVKANWRITFRFADGAALDVNYEGYH